MKMLQLTYIKFTDVTALDLFLSKHAQYALVCFPKILCMFGVLFYIDICDVLIRNE